MGLPADQASVVARLLVAGWEAKPHTQKMGEVISLRKGNKIATVKPDGTVEEVAV